MSFGTMVKDLRIKQKKTLRQFCQDNQYDPSNWSKIERDINRPTKNEVILHKWAKSLGLTPDTEDWQTFMDTAAISRHEIPRDLTDKELLGKLPVFFRSIRGAEMSEEDLKQFIETIRELHRSDDD